MRGADLFGVALARGVSIGIAAAVVAVSVAVGLSPLSPQGVARFAEPRPGVAFDAAAIGAGVAILLVVVIGISAAAGARRLRGPIVTEARSRPSVAARVMEGFGLSPVPVNGVRLALEPGRGRSAVPVRTTIASVGIGVATLVAALTFGGGLDHLLASPDLYGVSWDVSFGLPDDDETFPDARPLAAKIAERDGVEAVGVGSRGVPLQVDDVLVSGMVFTPVKGLVVPPVLEGRLPADDTELMVGTGTLDQLGKRIGDTVELSVQGVEPVEMTIVGRAVVPPVGSQARFGEGLFFSYDVVYRLGERNPLIAAAIPPPDEIAVRFEPGTDRAAVEAAIREDFADELGEDYELADPVDLVNFGRVHNTPLVLAGLLAALAVATLVHASVTAIQRRRRDLAILKTLGFVRRQIRWTVAWQAGALALATLVVGIPVGIAGGRWIWTYFADNSGILAEPVIPGRVWLVPPIALAIAIVASMLPARAAARTQPAVVLRTE
jgi:hypothetical protein